MINHSWRSPKLLLLLCLCLQLCYQNAQGQYLHNLIADTAEVKIDPEVNPVVVGDHVIYQVIENDHQALWSYNRITAKKTLLFNDKIYRFNAQAFEPFHDTYLYAMGDFAIFSVYGDFVGNRKIWRTDGTEEGTFSLGDDGRYVLPQIRVKDELVFTTADEILPAKTSSQGLFTTDGVTSAEHDITNPFLDGICAFDVNDVISSNWDYTAGKRQILRSTNNKITVLSDLLSSEHDTGSLVMWSLSNTCYIGLRKDQASSYEVMIVQRDGAAELLSETVDLTGIYHVFPYKNRLFAQQSLVLGETVKLKRFQQDLAGFDADITLPEPRHGRFNTLATDDYLIVHDFQGYSGSYSLHYLDINLVKNTTGLGGSSSYYGFERYVLPGVHPTLNGTLYTNSLFRDYRPLDVLSYSLNQYIEPKVELLNTIIFHVATHRNNPVAYVMLGNKWSGITSINVLADVPSINKATNGIWRDPVIKNQGVAITTGTRVDGSEYIFVTVYTYQDGQPLWLAGVGEIGLPQSPSIDLPLAQYNGIDTFEAGINPEQEIYGSLNLTMTGCNSLTATFNTAVENHVLHLTRIHNTEFNHHCND